MMLFILNPGRSLSDVINKALGSKVIQNAQTHIVLGRKRDPVFRDKKYNTIGFQIGHEF